MTTTRKPERLSHGLGALWVDDLAARRFDVLIVGSGYGGSMAAAELAGQVSRTGRPLRVGVLERGREYLPGEFPSHFSELPGHLRLARQHDGSVGGAHEGLFDLRLGDDVNALVANGLGGGSLINAGVLLKPDPSDFAPGMLRDLVGGLDADGYFKEARRLLGGLVQRGGQEVDNDISGHPGSGPQGLAKTVALARLGAAQRPPISVALAAGRRNSAEVGLNPCNLCGDCMSGCNVGAKDSLDANLLELAAARGAEIYTGASVLSLRRNREAGHRDDDPSWDQAPYWIVRTAHTSPELQRREKELLYLHARVVILAAGTLGSTEILLRSRSEKLLFSPRLGERFSCNGDDIAAIAGLPEPTRCCADEEVPTDLRQVGPTITGTVPVRAQGQARGFHIQEFSVPGALKPLFEEIVTTAKLIQRIPQADEDRHGHEPAGRADPLAVIPADMARTLLVGVIGHDDAAGTLHLPRPLRPRDRPPQQGTLRIHWPQARHGSALNAAHQELARRAAAIQAQLVANPMWRLLPPKLEDLVSQPRGPVLTVHPLGGCPMAGDRGEGVVDGFGRVFDASAASPDACFAGLLVLDGAILPGSLGANPALTIAATALRAARQLCRDQGFQHPGPLVPPQPRPRRMLPDDGTRPNLPQLPTRIEIVERLVGVVPLQVGKALPEPHVVELTLGYQPFELNAMRTDLNRRLRVVGDSPQSVIRIYAQRTWDERQLRVASDEARASSAVFAAHLEGELRFLHREPSGPWRRRLRSIPAWLFNRGLRDAYQQFFGKPSGKPQTLADYATDLLNLATRAGEVRRFDYALKIGTPIKPWADWQARPQGQAILGAKRLTYDRRANPWHQLMRLSLTRMPGMRAAETPILALDTRFLANQGFPLLRITQQQDQARALLDLICFGLLWLRVLISIHLWTFRKPDTPATYEPQRLPGKIEGLAEPEITELVVDRMPSAYDAAIHDPRRPSSLLAVCGNVPERPVRVRLTRYLPPEGVGDGSPLPPLAMIHGYSVSGNTFTHESLDTSAAAFFCRQGREVWVIDLRTSTGLDTATAPWSMEQVALVDIPAALLHIRNATGRKVDVLAHCIGCVMLSMALLTRADEVRDGSMQLGVEAWLTSEQLGTLAAFNGRAALDATQGHPCVAGIVLSQKGPLLRYTDDNVFRAFLLQSTRRWLMSDSYRFRPPRDPGVADQLLDRLLSSLPYPDEDYDVENPLWPCKLTPWTASRHRMDLLYGRDFNAANLEPGTLDAIDDLFGPISMDTVAQTIHFARFDAITNQRGRGEFVTLLRLHERWRPIPTLILHGKRNGLVDESTQGLLQRHFETAGVPLTCPPTDGEPYRQLGHQDLLIGRQATAVFQDIEDFLRARPALPAMALGEGRVFALPWIGPRIDLPDPDPGVGPGAVRVACMSRPDYGEATLHLFPVRQDPETLIFSLLGPATAGLPGSSGDWLFATPPATLPPDPGDPHSGYLALLVYDRDQAIDCEGPAWPGIPAGGPLPMGAAAAPPNDVLTGARDWLDERPAPLLQDAFISAGTLARARAMQFAAQPQPGARFALASCQYPLGLIDGPVAQASLRRLADAAQAPEPVCLALFVGDQIYADATAGLIDPARRDERYDAPHERALRATGMRRVLRGMPARMLPDDHEIIDNWEPLPDAVDRARPLDGLHNRLLQKFGFAAWSKYQQMRPPPPSGRADMAFRYAGFPFYLADTRNGRSARGSTVAPNIRRILSPDQEAELLVWLARHRDEVKFVATPSLLLPRRLGWVRTDPLDSARSDAWDGYRESLARLLRFIIEEGIRHTVFLSGDEHHSLVAEIELRRAGHAPVRVVSVHASALYAPFPFANGRPGELALPQDRFSLGGVDVSVACRTAPVGDGFAVLSVDERQRLHVAFSRAGDAQPRPFLTLPL